MNAIQDKPWWNRKWEIPIFTDRYDRLSPEGARFRIQLAVAEAERMKNAMHEYVNTSLNRP